MSPKYKYGDDDYNTPDAAFSRIQFLTVEFKHRANSYRRFASFSLVFMVLLTTCISAMLVSGVDVLIASRYISAQDNPSILSLQTIIVRILFTLLTILVLLMLANIYRLNVRLSTFYDARSDALFLLQDTFQGDSFEHLIAALSPQQIESGAASQLPLEPLLEIVRKAVKSESQPKISRPAIYSAPKSARLRS